MNVPFLVGSPTRLHLVLFVKAQGLGRGRLEEGSILHPLVVGRHVLLPVGHQSALRALEGSGSRSPASTVRASGKG